MTEVVSILGPHAETFQLVTLLGLPLWLELAAPIVLAYGFALGAPKAPAPAPKAKRRKQKRAPRKPAGARPRRWARTALRSSWSRQTTGDYPTPPGESCGGVFLCQTRL
ncbi:MAG TPA: hypothetical protein VFZ16_11440 [Hyphomicrobiaceae bacterium]|nr:hypothetical protein [Hyphomicrobiaceae bacterium]